LLVNPITKSSKPDEITAAYDIRNKNLIVARICACPDTRESLEVFLAIPDQKFIARVSIGGPDGEVH